MIHIYYKYISEANHTKYLEQYLNKFSYEFQNKVSRFYRWQDAQLSLLGRVLLCEGLKNFDLTYDNLDLDYTEFNKPYFKNSKIKFNISHSGEIVICVLTNDVEIGIDIEIMNETNLEDFKSQMTINEWQIIINSEDKTRSFFKYWTEKEAVIKSHGNGLSIPLKSFEVSNDKTEIDNQVFYLKSLPIDENYYCCISSTVDFKSEVIEFLEY